jgi:outer membrane immunogenic protein
LVVNKLIVAAIAAFGFAGSAFAADIPVKAPMVPVAAPFNWTGLYVGAVAGGAWGSSVQFFTGAPGGSTDRYNIQGINGGGTLGYNWQFDPHWVAGIEADFSGAHIKGTGISSATYGCGTECSTNVNWFGTARGRLGYAFDHWLFYGTGGLAYGNIVTVEAGGPVNTTRAGWTAGGGAEYAFNRNWSAKLEYLYVNFSSYVYSNATNAFFGCAGLNCSTDARFSVVRLGANYKFW